MLNGRECKADDKGWYVIQMLKVNGCFWVDHCNSHCIVPSFLLRNANLNLKITLLLYPQALVSVKWRITPFTPWTAAQYLAN